LSNSHEEWQQAKEPMASHVAGGVTALARFVIVLTQIDRAKRERGMV